MSSQLDLEQLYRSATYVVEDNGFELPIRLGHPNKELTSLLHDREAETWAFLTAYNPGSRTTERDNNKVSHAKLVARLTSSGLKYLNGYGTGKDWEPEPSLFILDIDRDAAVDLGREFGQSAILYGDTAGEPELVWCERHAE